MTKMIAEISKEIADNEVRIAKEQDQNVEHEKKIAELEEKKTLRRNEKDELNNQHRKDRDEPVRWGKANDNLRKAVEHV